MDKPGPGLGYSSRALNLYGARFVTFVRFLPTAGVTTARS